MLTPQIPIAREGFPFIFYFSLLTVIVALLQLPLLAAAFFAITTFVICFFRDPERFVPEVDGGIICPADGKVIVIEDVTTNDFSGDPARKVSIFMNVFNVHVNRIPCNGKVIDVQYRPGKFYSADSDKGALHNECCAATVVTETGSKIVFVQIAGLIARRIVCWLEKEDNVQSGRRFGLIRFGSRVDLYLPPGTQIDVKIGQKVRAGETILGRLS